MINMKLKAVQHPTNGKIWLTNADGDIVAEFMTAPFFYIVTGFKTVEAYNAHHDEQPTKFLLWKREH